MQNQPASWVAVGAAAGGAFFSSVAAMADIGAGHLILRSVAAAAT